ncbi:MAG: alpha/beta hydrolase [Verrucomicrobiota bacterium]
MLPAAAKALDWLTIQFARRSPQRGFARDAQRSEVLAHLADPQFFADCIAAPADFKLNSTHAFEFTSPIHSPWPANNRAYGRLYRCGEDWQSRPSVILIHGWNGEMNYYTLFPWLAKRLAQHRVNTALLVLPYHAGRKPRGRGVMRNFISDDVPRVLEATQQSVADIRALAAWLRAQGSPQITVWGFSLGAWLTGLVACLEEHLQRYVLATPIVSMQRAMELPFCEPLHAALQHFGARLDRFDLAALQPRVPPDNILLAESLHDLFAPADTVEALWRAWNQPPIQRFPHGHISILFSPAAMKNLVAWVVQSRIIIP